MNSHAHNKHKNDKHKNDKHRKNELDEDYDLVPVHNPKRRKHRTTFPLSREFTEDEYDEDLDKLYETQHKHKRKQSYPFFEYDQQQYTYIKEYNHKDKQYKKEIIIKNYKKVQPINDTEEKDQEQEQEQEKEEEDNLLVIKIPTAAHLFAFLTKKILKLLCYFGIISCAAL